MNRASSFIMRTNSAVLPATYSASAVAASLPDAMATPFISSSTVTICPGPRFMSVEPGRLVVRPRVGGKGDHVGPA